MMRDVWGFIVVEFIVIKWNFENIFDIWLDFWVMLYLSQVKFGQFFGVKFDDVSYDIFVFLVIKGLRERCIVFKSGVKRIFYFCREKYFEDVFLFQSYLYCIKIILRLVMLVVFNVVLKRVFIGVIVKIVSSKSVYYLMLLR